MKIQYLTYSTFASRTGLLPCVTEARIASRVSISAASKSEDPTNIEGTKICTLNNEI